MLDITHIDYRIQGYKKKKTENNLGDISTVEYYVDYDPVADEWTNLKVKETREFIRDDSTGIPSTNTVLIEWFGSDKGEARAIKSLIKPLNFSDGIKANVTSRTRLITNAKVTAIGILGLASGQAFLVTVSLDIQTYQGGNIQPLIDSINNCAESQAFKDAMIAILDVSYIPT